MTDYSDIFQAAGGHAFPADRAEFFAAHVRPNGQPWSWTGYEYLRDRVADDSAHIVDEKAAQMGLTTLNSGELLYHLAHGTKVGYFLPTGNAIRDYVQLQLSPVINSDRRLVRAIVDAGDAEPSRDGDGADPPPTRDKAADSVRALHLRGAQGVGTANFRSVQKLIDVKQIPLDAAYCDEVAELARKVDPELGVSLVDFLPDRLMASRLGHMREFSQPGIPGMDIDEPFQRSSQRYYQHRCTASNA